MDGHSDSDDRINTDELVEYLQEAPIRLAVFGEFSAGKTTALNALIGEEILSVAVEPTTAVPTRIRYGREFNIFIERVDGETLALFEDDPPFWTRFVGRRDTLNTLEKQQDTIRDFLQRWTKEGEKAGEVERVIIELPLDWLKGGLELVDTPGVNNEFVRHQGFTEQEAGDADIAVLLMDARQGGAKRTEFEFMNDVQQQVERCIVAPNKMDLIPADEREEFLGYIRETALPKHWEGAVTPPVMGISALAALHPEKHEEPGLVASFEEVRERLETLAREERGKLLLARKGNPEKQLFAQAREREAEGEHDRAHRLYFDLLDVMEAAGLDPTPAEEGIARCEENLSAQVDTLDELNERYNEAMTLAEEDPDSALERLEAIRDEKEELRLEDGDLHASIEQLQSRIEERDAAREEIQQIKAKVQHHRENENWIEAGEAAQSIPSLIDTAELTEKEKRKLSQFVQKQVEHRDKWAVETWTALKERIDQLLEADRFVDARETAERLREVAPYTPFEAETANFVEETEEKADLGADYRQAVRNAVEKAEMLRQDQVGPKTDKEIREAIEAVMAPYRSLYGYPDLPDVSPISDAVPSLTINQKLGLAQQLSVLSEHTSQEQISELLSDLQERKSTIDAVEVESGDASTQARLLKKYPDHPVLESTFQELTEESVWFWKFPWNIIRIKRSLNGYKSVLGEEKTKEIKKEIEKKIGNSIFFYCSLITLITALLLIFTINVINPYLNSKSKYENISSKYENISRMNIYEQTVAARKIYKSGWYKEEIKEWIKSKKAIPFSVIKKDGTDSEGVIDEVKMWNRKEAEKAFKYKKLNDAKIHIRYDPEMTLEKFAINKLPSLVEKGNHKDALEIARKIFNGSFPHGNVVEKVAKGCSTMEQCREFAEIAQSYMVEDARLRAAENLLSRNEFKAAAALAGVEARDSVGRGAHSFWQRGESELLSASKSGDADAVKALLSAGIDTNIRTETRVPPVKGNTPLMEAAREGNDGIVRLLMKAGADPALTNGEGGGTALTYAASNGNTESVQVLVENGADPNLSTGIMGKTPLEAAARSGDSSTVKALLYAGASPKAPETETDKWPHEIACSEGNLKSAELLHEKAEDIEESKIYPKCKNK